MTYPDLPTRYVPREGTAPIGTLLEVQVDGEPSTAVLVGLRVNGQPASFSAWPGPAQPTEPGSYLVLVSDGAQPEAIGWLVVY